MERSFPSLPFTSQMGNVTSRRIQLGGAATGGLFPSPVQRVTQMCLMIVANQWRTISRLPLHRQKQIDIFFLLPI